MFTRKQQILIPPDVRKVASSTTLRVLYAGRINHWSKDGLLWQWFRRLKLSKERENIYDASSEAEAASAQPPPPPKQTEQASTLPTKQPSKASPAQPSKASPAQPSKATASLATAVIDKVIDTVAPKSPEVFTIAENAKALSLPPVGERVQRESVIGKHLFQQRQRHHRQLPTLSKPTTYQPHVSLCGSR